MRLWTRGERSSSAVTSRARSRSTGSPMVTISRTLTAPTLPTAAECGALRLRAELVGADVGLAVALDPALIAVWRGLLRGVVDRRAAALQRERVGGPAVVDEVPLELGLLVHTVALAVEPARV